MCIASMAMVGNSLGPPLGTPVNRSDPNAMKVRFFQVLSNAMLAGQGDTAAKARLQNWKSMIVQKPAATGGQPAPTAAPAATAAPGPTAQAMGRP